MWVLKCKVVNRIKFGRHEIFSFSDILMVTITFKCYITRTEFVEYILVTISKTNFADMINKSIKQKKELRLGVHKVRSKWQWNWWFHFGYTARSFLKHKNPKQWHMQWSIFQIFYDAPKRLNSWRKNPRLSYKILINLQMAVLTQTTIYVTKSTISFSIMIRKKAVAAENQTNVYNQEIFQHFSHL